MQTRLLGNTGAELSVIGFGAAAIAGGRDYGFVERDADEAIRTIIRAFEFGINWVDTAPKYADGCVEELVGRALKEWGAPVFVATKCGYSFDEHAQKPVRNLKRASIFREIDDSLRRLCVEWIDLYQVHWPVPDEDIEEAFTAVSDLIDMGKVRFAGVSNFSVEQLKRIAHIRTLDALQPPYNMLERGIEASILPYCRERNIGVLAYSPMLSGLLTGAFDRARIESLPERDWRRHIPHFSEPLLTRNLQIISDLTEVAQELEVTLPQLAVAWTIAHTGITAAIVGARTPSQIAGTAAAGSLSLGPETLAKIEAIIGLPEPS